MPMSLCACCVAWQLWLPGASHTEQSQSLRGHLKLKGNCIAINGSHWTGVRMTLNS